LYLRHTIRRKGGKEHTYWQLVRSVRRGGRVRQESVAQLGELDAQGRLRAQALGAQITGGAMQGQLFEPPPQWAAPVTVRLEEVRVERARAFGGVWLGRVLWRSLKFDQLCETLMPRGREAVPWAPPPKLPPSPRLCEPSSELHIAEDWYRRTALEDLIGLPAGAVKDDRLYRALDRLLPHKVALEQHLRARLGELFALDYDLLLYDVTSTYFEGAAAGNRLAQRGYSRDHRPDCKQVNLALVVTREGLPLGYELFAGNRADSHHGQGNHRDHGAALWNGQSDLGNGPRHGQRRQPEVAQSQRPALPDREYAGGAQADGPGICHPRGLAISERGGDGKTGRRQRPRIHVVQACRPVRITAWRHRKGPLSADRPLAEFRKCCLRRLTSKSLLSHFEALGRSKRPQLVYAE
jgi:hypothetical protein